MSIVYIRPFTITSPLPNRHAQLLHKLRMPKMESAIENLQRSKRKEKRVWDITGGFIIPQRLIGCMGAISSRFGG